MYGVHISYPILEKMPQFKSIIYCYFITKKFYLINYILLLHFEGYDVNVSLAVSDFDD